MEINSEINEISIEGIPNEAIKIDYNDDVDFTKLVSSLTKLIDDKKKITLEKMESIDDEKLELIVDTISGIFDKYNEAILLTIEPDENEDDDLPF